MAEYIERKIATNVIGNIDTSHPYDDKDDIVEQAIGLIDHIPSADVAPVRHGRWIEPQRLYYGAKQYECSLCRAEEFWDKHEITEKYPCCPNCGAKMDGGADNGC